MRSRDTSNTDIERHLFRPQPASLETLAPALGLGKEASLQEVTRALDSLVTSANRKELSAEGQAALSLICLATTPEAGTFNFGEVRPVSFAGTVKTVRDVEQAIETVRSILDATALEAVALPTTEVSKHGQDVGSKKGVNEHHISQVLPRALHSSLECQRSERYLNLEEAIVYLQHHGILGPGVRADRPPSPETTELLVKHGMVWICKEKMQSWDPRLDTNRNQSLFTAAPEYLQRILGAGSQLRRELAQKALKARKVEENPEYRARLPHRQKEEVGQLLILAESLLQEPEVPLAKVMRIEALYGFLRSAGHATTRG